MGYGRFGAVYNPYQEEYVEKYPLSVTEVQNIRPVNMPYNEFLEQCLGGGLLGGVFFLSIPIYFAVLAYQAKTLDRVGHIGKYTDYVFVQFCYASHTRMVYVCFFNGNSHDAGKEADC